ncbi:MAG: PilZ domain-containing protein [Xanthobacteraceae bacterium]
MVNAPLLLDDDLEVVDCRTDFRIVLSVPGRLTLASRRDMEGKRKEFPCRVINMSCHAVTFATPATGASVGERVISLVDHFGKLEGPIIRVMDGGFVMEIIAPKRERRRLAAKIEWYEKHKNHDADDLREHVRFIPRNPYSTLVLADGTTTECLVMDVSASGIAVSADVIPDIGTPVAVGKVVGRMVRHFNNGFAVHFAQLQEPDAIEDLVAPLR